jgi:hypothetical protein
MWRELNGRKLNDLYRIWEEREKLGGWVTPTTLLFDLKGSFSLPEIILIM